MKLVCDVPEAFRVLFLQSQFKERFRIVKGSVELFAGVQFAGKSGPFLEYGSGGFGMIPEVLVGDDGFNFFQSIVQAVQVKDTPSTEGVARGIPGCAVSVLRT